MGLLLARGGEICRRREEARAAPEIHARTVVLDVSRRSRHALVREESATASSSPHGSEAGRGAHDPRAPRSGRRPRSAATCLATDRPQSAGALPPNGAPAGVSPFL